METGLGKLSGVLGISEAYQSTIGISGISELHRRQCHRPEHYWSPALMTAICGDGCSCEIVETVQIV